MAFCSNCGTQLPDEVRYCPSCGTPLKKTKDNSMKALFDFKDVKFHAPKIDFNQDIADLRTSWEDRLTLFKDFSFDALKDSVTGMNFMLLFSLILLMMSYWFPMIKITGIFGIYENVRCPFYIVFIMYCFILIDIALLVLFNHKYINTATSIFTMLVALWFCSLFKGAEISVLGISYKIHLGIILCYLSVLLIIGSNVFAFICDHKLFGSYKY